jgi:hypothetical protein
MEELSEQLSGMYKYFFYSNQIKVIKLLEFKAANLLFVLLNNFVKLIWTRALALPQKFTKKCT